MAVVPYIGTWIETLSGDIFAYWGGVVPYIGTWIETSLYSDTIQVVVSYLI